MRMRIAFLFPLMWMLGVVPATAQVQQRKLEVPASSTWKHAVTEMMLPSRVGDLTRRSIGDLGADEMDIVAEYDSPDGVVATVYLFRTAFPEVPVWFDRALTVLRQQPGSGMAGTPLPGVAAFARPGAANASGLRTAMDVTGGDRKSTALALAPVTGSYLLKIRISSNRLDKAALDAEMSALIEGLRWPAEKTPSAASSPVEDCDSPLRLKKARLVKPSMGQQLLSALVSVVPPNAVKEAGTRYCREPGASEAFAVYRPGGAKDSYIIALRDAGFALSLAPALIVEGLTSGGGEAQWSMTLLGRAGASVLPSFDRLPPPEQAVAVLARNSSGPRLSIETRDR